MENPNLIENLVMTEIENKLNELMKISPSIFLNKCIRILRNGEEGSEFCKYIQLKMLNETGKPLDEIEKMSLYILSEKYGNIDTGVLLSEYERLKKDKRLG